MCGMPKLPRQRIPYEPKGPTRPRWDWPREYDALDRLERELVEDVAAAILSAKRAKLAHQTPLTSTLSPAGVRG